VAAIWLAKMHLSAVDEQATTSPLEFGTAARSSALRNNHLLSQERINTLNISSRFFSSLSSGSFCLLDDVTVGHFGADLKFVGHCEKLDPNTRFKGVDRRRT
jgi:hypothetical protein